MDKLMFLSIKTDKYPDMIIRSVYVHLTTIDSEFGFDIDDLIYTILSFSRNKSYPLWTTKPYIYSYPY